MGKEVGHPLLPRTQVKTKVESSLSQVPVSSLVQGSLGSFDFAPQSPLGPSGRTHSNQKIIGDFVERERRARPLPSSLFCFVVAYYCCCSVPFFFFSFFLTDE